MERETGVGERNRDWKKRERERQGWETERETYEWKKKERERQSERARESQRER